MATGAVELSPEQLAMLRAMVDRIIPADDSPAAWDAGAGEYIQMQLKSGQFAGADLIAFGLSMIGILAIASYGRPFERLNAEEQDTVLEGLENHGMLHLRKFFKALVELTIEGYYADWSRDGDRPCASWEMLGYRPSVERGDHT